jgi:DNA modification methylase
MVLPNGFLLPPFWSSVVKVEQIGLATLYFGDNRELQGFCADALISDPPYGMAYDTDSTRFSGGNVKRGAGRSDWGVIQGDSTDFDPSPWLAFPRVVLWGSNHYAQRLPVGTTLVWLKKADHLFGTWLSDCEIGWMKGGHGVYAFRKQFPPPSRQAENDGKTVAHPTQKPIALMQWCLDMAKVATDQMVFDPFMGSGSTGVACVTTGRRFTGCEIDERHFTTACRRIENAQRQSALFE